MALTNLIYTKATIRDGNLNALMQEASVSIDFTSGSQPVKTVQLGYSGESPGSPMCELSVSEAVPASTIEMLPESFMDPLQSTDFTIELSGGQYLLFSGFIYQSNFSHAVDSQAKLDFKARGQLAKWQGN